MALPESTSEETPQVWRSYAPMLAKTLADLWKLDESRAAEVLCRLADIGWVQASKPVCRSPLEEAIYSVGTSEALRIFETEPLHKLHYGVLFVHYINRRDTPVYTLEKLGELTEEFLSHFKRNKQHLIKTGYPKATFEKCRWLDWHVNKLCYVKVPAISPLIRELLDRGVVVKQRSAKYNTIIEPDQDGNRRYRYRWVKERAIRFCWGGGGAMMSTTGPLVAPCKYEEAPVVEGLEQKDADSLAGMRGKLFKLKIEILQRLVQAAKDRDGAKLWHDCLTILTDNLSAEEVAFLKRTDRFFVDLQPGDEFTYSPMQGQVVYRIAGLTDLLEVIGHYEQELTIGHMNRVSEALMDLPSDIALSSYYEIIGKSWRGVVDRALCRLLVGSGADRFWEMYGHRVNHALKTELYDEKALREQLKRKLAQKRGVLESAISEMVGGILESPDEARQMSYSRIVDSLAPGDNVFLRMGHFWVVRYRKKTRILEHTNGMNYMGMLLANPNREISALVLTRAVEGAVLQPVPKEYGKMTEEQLREEGLSNADVGDAGFVLDEQAEIQYRARLRDLDHEIEKAEQLNDLGTLNKAREEKEWILQELSAARGLRGQKRKASDPEEKARKAVSEACRRTLKVLEKEHHALWEHLNNTIRLGYRCKYSPGIQIDWILQ